MQTEHTFARDEVYPSWFANALGHFLSLGAFGFVITKQDATHIQVTAGADDLAAAIAISGRWRWNEATATRAHPGGAAGTYDIYVTAADNDIVAVPAPYTDTTNYGFALAIVAAGATPAIVPGTVDIYRHVGSLQWDGAQITRVDQTVPHSPSHAHTHATGQSDVIAPADIGAATEADLLAEVARAEVAEPTAGELAALPGTNGVPGNLNRYVTDSDPRNSDQRVPTDGSVTDAKVAAGAGISKSKLGALGIVDADVAAGAAIAKSKLAALAIVDADVSAAAAIAEAKLALATDAAANVGSRRTLGTGAQQAAAGNDPRWLAIRSVAANTNAVNGDLIIVTGGNPLTVTLPAPAAGARVGVFVAAASGGSPVTVAGTKIFGLGLNNAASFPLGTVGAQVELRSDGTNWYIVKGQQDSGWVALTLGGTTSAVAGAYTPSARLIGDRVFLCGAVSGNFTGGTTTIFTVPVGLRPASTATFGTSASTGAASSALRLTISATGAAVSDISDSNATISLDNMSYRIA